MKAPNLYKEYGYLLNEKIVTDLELQRAIFISKQENTSIATTLIKQFKTSKEAIGISLSNFYKCDFIEYDPQFPLAIEVITSSGLDKQQLLYQCWFPFSWDENGIVVLVDDPSSFQKSHLIMTALDTDKVIFSVGIREDIHAYINRAFQELEVSDAFSKAMSGDPSVDISQLVDMALLDAYLKGASDIHFESSAVRKDHRVRLRIDGVCQEYAVLPPSVGKDVVKKIKSMANLDGQESGLPHKGIIKFSNKNRQVPEFMLQVTTYPTDGHLEDAVLRILAAREPMSLESMLLSDRNFALLKRNILKPYGLYLAAGSPGSGKSTLLHKILQYINKPGVKIVTAEYPLEIRQPGLSQLEVDLDKGMNFPVAIRCLMRADPDVIMISAMDDAETAQLCLEAAVSGCFVLSTLTAATAPDAIELMLDFGLQPIKLSDGLLGVIAQKLVRKLCIHCMEQCHPTKNDFDGIITELGEKKAALHNIAYRDDLIIYNRVGCHKCSNTGYTGRIAINELIEITPGIKSLIRKKTLIDATTIRECAIKQGMVTFEEDGILKLLQGLTDFVELKRVVAQ
jgi:type II secretory ATPase GspE/PulE/Tfp pilus assembly ATPase PilB-like protein